MSHRKSVGWVWKVCFRGQTSNFSKWRSFRKVVLVSQLHRRLYFSSHLMAFLRLLPLFDSECSAKFWPFLQCVFFMIFFLFCRTSLSARIGLLHGINNNNDYISATTNTTTTNNNKNNYYYCYNWWFMLISNLLIEPRLPLYRPTIQFMVSISTTCFWRLLSVLSSLEKLKEQQPLSHKLASSTACSVTGLLWVVSGPSGLEALVAW